MAQERWRQARVERGKPRIYIQQFLELTLPERDYLTGLGELREGPRPADPFADDSGILVLEALLEDLDDGSQSDTVHVHRAEGQVVLMTVISYPYSQEKIDRLRAEYLARKAVGSAAADADGEDSQ